MEIGAFKARRIPMKFFIGTYMEEVFSIAEDGVPVDVTSYTWEFFIKEYPGARLKLLSLTLGNGLSFPVYTTDQIQLIITAAQAEISEGEKYYELRRTDLIIPYLNGPAYFYVGDVDSQ